MVIISILASVSIPAIVQAIPNFRLRSLSYDFLAASQQARGLAIKENRNVNLTINSNGFSFDVDTDGDGDVDGSDTPVATSFSGYGNTQSGTGEATVDWEGDGSMTQTNSFVFTSRGTLNSGVKGTVYFDNGESGTSNQLCYAITISATGFVKLRKYIPCDDTDKKNCWLD